MIISNFVSFIIYLLLATHSLALTVPVYDSLACNVFVLSVYSNGTVLGGASIAST